MAARSLWAATWKSTLPLCRVLAWPVFACNNSRGSWMLHKRWSQNHLAGLAMTTGTPPLHLRQGLIPFADEALKPVYACLPASLLNSGCNSHQSLLPFEFRHWRNATAAAPPSADNTVFVADGVLLHGLRLHAAAAVTNTSAIVVIDELDAAEGLARLQDEALVYVGHPLLVRGFDDSSEAFKSRIEECTMLHRHWSKHEPRMRLVEPAMPSAALSADQRTLVLAAAAN